MYRTLIASLGVVALVLAASETFADPGVVHVGGLAPPRPAAQPPVGRPLHRHHRATGGFLPSAGGYFYEPSHDEPMMMDARQPRASDELRYTCTLDIPWDYVHRCPQVVAPRE
jgi:hypothetical protein